MLRDTVNLSGAQDSYSYRIAIDGLTLIYYSEWGSSAQRWICDCLLQHLLGTLLLRIGRVGTGRTCGSQARRRYLLSKIIGCRRFGDFLCDGSAAYGIFIPPTIQSCREYCRSVSGMCHDFGGVRSILVASSHNSCIGMLSTDDSSRVHGVLRLRGGVGHERRHKHCCDRVNCIILWSSYAQRPQIARWLLGSCWTLVEHRCVFMGLLESFAHRTRYTFHETLFSTTVFALIFLVIFTLGGVVWVSLSTYFLSRKAQSCCCPMWLTSVILSYYLSRELV